MVTPKTDVDTHKYAENVEDQIFQLTNVKTITSVLIVMVITLQETENVKLNEEKERSRNSNKKESGTEKSYSNTFRRRRNRGQ